MKIILGVTAFLCSMLTYGQEDSVKTLINKTESYYNNTLQEKLFLHIDRSSYLTGETIWFKIYNVDAVLHKGLNVSKVAYVDIIDATKNAIVQKKIKLNETGNGSIFLPASISSGNYQIRAYTNWMKNFSPDFYFEQTISIINPFIKLGLKPADNKISYDVQFFPEGGNLVYGLNSKIAFRAVDQNGNGIDFRGAIINETKDTIAYFRPHKFGIGNFTFLPQSEHQYTAVITDSENKKFFYSLPPIHRVGYTLQLTDSSANWLIVNVVSNSPNAQNFYPVYLLMHSKQNVVSCEMHLMQAGATSFIIEKKKVKNGISHITLFDHKLSPVCERLYFKQPEQKIIIETKTDFSQYALRKKVKVNISSKTPNGQSALMDLSASVYKKDVLQTDNINIDEYLLLTSELTGHIENPAYYLTSDISIDKQQALDNLMLTHGWSRFKWQEVLSDKNSFQNIPEMGSHIISGYITDIKTGQPGKNIVAYLSSPDKNIRLYVSRSDVSGKIEFETTNFYDNKDIIVTTNSRQDSSYVIKLFSPFSDKYSVVKIQPLNLNEGIKTDLEQRALHMQVQNIFYEKLLNQRQNSLIDSSTFYGKPDRRYFLDDYTRFPTMEEVMREYIAEVNVRKRGGKFHFYNLDIPNGSVFNEEPLILLDGVPIFETNKIIDFDPRKIKRLDAMTRTYYLGALSFPGIVSYSTYRGDMGGFQLDSRALVQSYEGVQSQREFFSPIYETPQEKTSTIPDTRNLLSWVPNLKTDADGKAYLEFYTSDVSGQFNVVVQGITKDGKPGHSITSFEVKDKLNY